MRKNKKQIQMEGSDGRTYRGKGAKKRKRLEKRITDFNRTSNKQGYTQPGSMK